MMISDCTRKFTSIVVSSTCILSQVDVIQLCSILNEYECKVSVLCFYTIL